VIKSIKNKYYIIDEEKSPQFITFRLKYQKGMIPFDKRKENLEENKQEPEITG
jgi:uncharacterized protein YjiK